MKHLLCAILMLVASPAIAQTPAGIPGSWTLVFEDTFAGGAYGDLMTWDKWNLNWFGDPSGVRKYTKGVHSAEIAAYDPDSCILDGAGNAILWAKPKTVSAWMGGSTFQDFDHVTCHLNTMGKFEVVYGVMEARVYMPGSSPTAVPYNWFAVWMNGDHDSCGDWPCAGEIDIMENLSNGPDVHIHYGSPDIDYSPSITAPTGGWSGSWHTYAVMWDNDEMEFYYDGVKVGERAIVDAHPKYIGIQYGMSLQHGGPVSDPRLAKASHVRYWCQTGTNCVQ